ncbi:MAG: hypothetical protein ABW019_02330 [Chitinophagaceae bacterium]
MLSQPALSQDNSPYTRYGLGDLVPSTNINSRGMGGISAGYNDILSINFNNPASYASFQAVGEQTSKKMAYGRALLDVGLNIDNRTLSEPNVVGKFTASNVLFSHVQVGVPLRPNWGLSFGLRPISRISYNIISRERLRDPNTNLPIDTASTTNQGDGGTYLASVGTGWRINLGKGQALSFGFNAGYLFGKKDYSTRRAIYNDSLSYNSGNFQTKTTYGNLFVNAGIQYQTKLATDLYLSLGVYGNWKQTLNASQDIIRETYYYNESTGNVRLDSVYDRKDIKGKIVYPSSYTGGFVIEKLVSAQKAGWLFGVDFSQGNWSEYRSYGQADTSVRNKWELRAGAQLRPVPKSNYFSNVAYRAGLFIGRDYIHVKSDLPLLGVSLGLGLPLRNYNRLSPGQATVINLAFEFIKRGNNDNLLKENMFRLSAGFSLSDFWFVRKKYE